MNGRRLKNYPLYLIKLETYAKFLGITVIRKEDYSEEGCYNLLTKSLTLDDNLAETTELATFLHELGHALDAQLYNKQQSSAIWRAYDKVYEELAGTKELETVIDAEIRAWENGKIIAKLLKIPLGSWYAKERKSALLNYRRSQ